MKLLQLSNTNSQLSNKYQFSIIKQARTLAFWELLIKNSLKIEKCKLKIASGGIS
jgi:hypothetical protein